MSKRMTEEERIMEYFNSQSPEKIDLMFNIVSGIVRKRRPKGKGQTAKPKAVPAQPAAMAG